MARKTKRQKLLAQLHRKLRETPSAVTPAQNFPSAEPVDLTRPVFSLPRIKKEEKAPVQAILPQNNTAIGDYRYVKSGLLRTLIFSLLAIGAQIVLWYLWRR